MNKVNFDELCLVAMNIDKENGSRELINATINADGWYILFEEIKNETRNLKHDKNMMSDIPGLFVGGDVTPRHLRQIYVAEHDGVVAAESIKRYLDEK